jgi:hypothetical protein
LDAWLAAAGTVGKKDTKVVPHSGGSSWLGLFILASFYIPLESHMREKYSRREIERRRRRKTSTQ